MLYCFMATKAFPDRRPSGIGEKFEITSHILYAAQIILCSNYVMKLSIIFKIIILISSELRLIRGLILKGNI